MAPTRTSEPSHHLNLTIVAGVISRAPEIRILPAGSTVTELDVTVRLAADGPSETIPVVVFDAPANVALLSRGDDVVVMGRVRRRFFRSSGATQSRTELVAELVTPRRSTAKVKAAFRHAVSELDQYT